MKFKTSIMKVTAILLTLGLVLQPGLFSAAQYRIDPSLITDLETETGEEEEWEEDSCRPDGMEEMSAEEQQSVSPDMEQLKASPSEAMYGTGYIDVDYTASLIGENTKGPRLALLGETPLPASYSSADQGYTTAIKDQKSSALCWAFSYCSAAESNMLKSGKAALADCQYSPLGLGYFFYHIPQDPLRLIGSETANTITRSGKDYRTLGGSYLVTVFSLSGWIGPLKETEIPFVGDYGGSASTVYDFEDYQLQAVQKGAYFLNSSEKNEIKRAIMEYGALSVGIRSNGTLGSGAANGHLRNVSGGRDFFAYRPTSAKRDHEVQIIGWNDSISKDLFETDNGEKPSHDGAWLVRNSWNSTWPSADAVHPGCFWLSYEDATIHDTMVALEMASGDEYYHNYHYDGNASTSSSRLKAAATVFQAQTTETITDVNVGFKDTNVEYTVSIYTSTSEPAGPTSGTLASQTTGTTKAEGFYTLHLDTPVTVAKNSWFSVVVNVPQAAWFYCEDSNSAFGESDVRMTADVKMGEGFLSSDGTTWRDGYTMSSQRTPRIKAFTKNEGKYLVRWENADGKRLQLDQDVTPGTVPEYKGSTPVLPEQGGYRYIFKGWNKEVTAVAGDQIYKAVYNRVSSGKYLITWKNWNGEILDQQSLDYGATPVYGGSTPVREDEEGTYTFIGWSPEIGTVTGDQVYTAQFEPHLYTYTIDISVNNSSYGEVDVNKLTGITAGTVISAEGAKLKVGSTEVTAKAKSSTSSYRYEFKSWTCGDLTLSAAETVTVLADLAVKANFKATYIGGGGSGGGGGGGGGGGSSGGGGGGSSGASTKTASSSVTYSPNWYQAADGTWRIRDKQGQDVKSAWLCDDGVSSNGKEVWYLMNTDGTMLGAGLVQDNTGNFYSLETTHNGYYGMLRYKNGTYDCNGQQVYLEFSNKHDGTFGAVINADGLAKLKAIYGVTRFGVDNSSCTYTSTF